MLDKAVISEYLQRAERAASSAYAPFSNLRVGAVVRLRDGREFVGVNVENASFGLTMCAERVALGAAVAAGARPGDIDLLAVASPDRAITPCGACRQVIAEFGHDIRVLFRGDGGADVLARAGELLPALFSFGDEARG